MLCYVCHLPELWKRGMAWLEPWKRGRARLKPWKRGVARLEPWEGGMARAKQWKKEVLSKISDFDKKFITRESICGRVVKSCPWQNNVSFTNEA